jgi:O-antigen ligase
VKSPRAERRTAPVVAAPQFVPKPGRRHLATALAFLLAAIPLALVQGWFLSHDIIPKVILMLGGAAILLFALPGWLPGAEALWKTRAGKIFFLLAAAQFLSLAISTVFSTQPVLSLAGTVWRRFGLIEQTAILIIACAVASVAAGRDDSTRMLLRGITAGGGIASAYGIAQYAGFDPFLDRSLYAIDYLGGIVRPPATMGHAIYFSAYLVPITIVAAYEAMTETGLWWKYAGAITAVIAPVAILLSGTRASLLAVLAALTVFFLRRGSREGIGMFVRGAACVVVITGLIVLSPTGKTFLNRLQQWREDLGGTRLGVWRDSLALIAAHPIIGAGPETFAVEFRRIESPELSRRYPDFYSETPHNVFVDAAAGQGALGAALLVALVGFVLWSMIGKRRHAIGPGAALQSAFIGMIAGSFFASWTLVTGLFLWVLAAMIAALQSKTNPSAGTANVPFLWRTPAAAVGAIFLFCAATLAAQDFFWANLADAVAAKDFPSAESAYASATTLAAGMPGYELWGSRELATLARSLGKSPDAELAWRKAADASALAEQRGEERFSAAYQSSILAIASADLTRGESKARDAIALAPNWYKPHLLLAQILQAEGRGGEASREAGRSAALGWRRGEASTR